MSTVLGWTGALLLVLAAVAFVGSFALLVPSSGSDGRHVGDRAVLVHATGNRNWGIYVSDPDNSGYSEACKVVDPHGHKIPTRDPGWRISSSDTATLDLVFTTPAEGRFTVSCDVEGAAARVAPVESLRPFVIGFAAAVVLGLCGFAAGLTWLMARSSTPPRTS